MNTRRKWTVSLLLSILTGQIWLFIISRDVWYLEDPWLFFNIWFFSVLIVAWFALSAVMWLTHLIEGDL
jgi:hypothetical protein